MSVIKRKVWYLRWAQFGVVMALGAMVNLPLYGAIQVLDGLYQESTLALGTTTTGGLRLHNPTAQPQTIVLYQTDEQFEADAVAFPAVGSGARSNATWIQFEQEQWVVPPQSTITVPYQIKVPNHQDLMGTYWSVVMVQTFATAPVQEGQNTSFSLSIRQTFRTAVRMVTHLVTDPPVTPILQLKDSALTLNDEGVVGLDLALLNDGEISLQLRLYVELIDASGQRLGRFKPHQDQARLLPGNQTLRRVDFPDLVPGRYEVIAIAENQDGHVFGARYQLTINAR